MGYRSYGFFAFPKKYLPELERRTIEADIKWILDKSDPDNPKLDLGHFDEVEEFEDPHGFGTMLKITYSDWKWYSGYSFPQIVENFLQEHEEYSTYSSREEARASTFKELEVTYPYRFINYPDTEVTGANVTSREEPYAFVRVGEEHPDTEVNTNMYDIYATTYISNHPVSETGPITTIIFDVTSKQEGEVMRTCRVFKEHFDPKLISISGDDYYSLTEQRVRSYTPYSKQGEPPKPLEYNKQMFFGWHNDSMVLDPLNNVAISKIIKEMAEWIVGATKGTDMVATLSAFTIVDDVYEHGHLIPDELDFELIPSYDHDIYLSNDYVSEI